MTQNVGLNSVSYPQRSTGCTRFALELPPMVKTTSKSYSSRMAADTRNYQARSLSGHSMAWVVHIRWCMDSWTKLPGRPVDRAEDPAHQRRAWEYHVRFQIRVFHFTASVEVYNREWSFGNRGVRLKQIWSTCSMGHVPFRKRDCSVGNLHWAPHVLHVGSAVFKRPTWRSQIAASNHG